MAKRVRVNINGIVQGVGFRPLVYRYAKRGNLAGWVSNTSEGVVIEVEGNSEKVDDFLKSLKSFPPPQAKITRLSTSLIPPQNDKQFEILPSIVHSQVKTQISPDIATCPECLEELSSPGDRRYLYPFLNCTNCGPRFTIIKDIPYDRNKTTMEKFMMCSQCQEEYQDPLNRRFHAQPNACPECGPQVTLVQSDEVVASEVSRLSLRAKRSNLEIATSSALGGLLAMTPNPKTQSSGVRAIKETVKLLKKGKIVAIKGLGGFHLACDALNEEAVRNLRQRKYRENKPFALMARDLEIAKKFCQVSPEEEELLLSVKRPVVLLKKKTQIVADSRRRLSQIVEQVAPNNKYLGFMLPYTPLHYLLFYELRTTNYESLSVLVMTSGNICEEPIAYENEEAVSRLSTIADYFLFHNRDIYTRCDDSVTRIFLPMKREMLIRRSRGYAPSPLTVPLIFKNEILACGAHLKNTFCLAKGNEVFISHHIGDLENLETLVALEKSVKHFKKLFAIEPAIIAHDLHPEYLSTKYAHRLRTMNSRLRTIPIQHHHAHIVSCLADNGVDNHKVIGVAFDGTGYGEDGNIWGGEFLIADYADFERKAHLKYLPLPGAEQAIKEPWRMAATYLYETYGEGFLRLNLDFTSRLNKSRWAVLEKMIKRRINSPLTSSMGRLFDAVSSLLGLRDEITYEGQAAMELEMAIKSVQSSKFKVKSYKYGIEQEKKFFIIKPKEIIMGIVEDLKHSVPVGAISFKFHNTIVEMIVETCMKIRSDFNQNYKLRTMNSELNEVALSGGVFQNIFLLDRTFNRLIKEGFKVYLHRQVPTNDGGISLGQAVIANAKFKE
ncbi:MAG: carbamoyltransferase HypF [bacterium (Candidatus Ratteibacteria) CG_4_9_14_3_um_filter_41_21]|uniref:Carbamoyltransferase n=1 Tax=bacterium (Candidatus Ratteibacteria) CG_4_9_14_3_um_filter_41_21 TaxID=2014289 RepID=A0A2M7YGF2_9BACT|nr:MAG: carbamoyltransferase HypF [bacterium (Candidatus Ratteibacteria) CG_4_9_14_3_um_filter_41_21]